MRAAVVTEFTHPPRYGEFRDPEEDEGTEVVQVLAAGVHRVVRSRAAGEHYSAGGALPQVPGMDCVARTVSGSRVYTGGTAQPFGTLAELAPVPRGFAVPVPGALDDVTAAAIVNPAASSWVPLQRLLPRDRPATVLVLGATGVSGGLAVQIARRFGARVVAAGRDAARLAATRDLGADATVDLTGDVAAGLAEAAPEGADVILDYVWGDVSAAALDAVVRAPRDPRLAIEHVQLGSTGGRTLPLDGAALRSRNLRITGSGLGSVDGPTMLASVAGVLDAAADGALTVDARAYPLSTVEQHWGDTERLVFVP